MKKLFNVQPDSNQTAIGILLARVGIAALMLTHGVPKVLQLFSSAPVEFPAVMGMSSQLSLILTVFTEVICSLLVMVGLGTRIASALLAATMLVAAFYIHAADPFAVQEMSLHFLLVYLVLMITGSGKFSIDYLLQQKGLSK